MYAVSSHHSQTSASIQIPQPSRSSSTEPSADNHFVSSASVIYGSKPESSPRLLLGYMSFREGMANHYCMQSSQSAVEIAQKALILNQIQKDCKELAEEEGVSYLSCLEQKLQKMPNLPLARSFWQALATELESGDKITIAGTVYDHQSALRKCQTNADGIRLFAERSGSSGSLGRSPKTKNPFL